MRARKSKDRGGIRMPCFESGSCKSEREAASKALIQRGRARVLLSGYHGVQKQSRRVWLFYTKEMARCKAIECRGELKAAMHV
jgi:hypothetical protein